VKSPTLGNMRTGGLLNGIHNSSLSRTSTRSAVFFLGAIQDKLANKPGSVLALQQVTVIHLGAQLLIRSSNLPVSDASNVLLFS
jgi:uncharacterized protein YdaL